MNDERITKEMNQIKGYVCLYVFVASLVLGMLKTLILGFDMDYYFVELYVIFITLIIFGLVMIYRMKTIDERIEQNINKIFQIGFVVLFIGGLWVHFYQVIVNLTNQLVTGYITNTLILIGFIVTFILLKRRGLYANYKYIEHSKKRYYRHIAFNASLILFIFLLMYFSFVALSLLSLELSIVMLLMGISFIMISIEYILFSIYEKNHYDEMICFEQGNPNMLSKNVFLFQIVIFIFMTILAYTNLRLSLVQLTHLVQNQETLLLWTGINGFVKIMSIDFHILSLISMIIAYRYLVKLLGKSPILKVFLGFSIFGFFISLVSYVITLFTPMIAASFESGVQVEAFFQTFGTFNIIVSVIFSVFYGAIGIILFLKGVAYKKLVLTYAILTIALHPVVINFILKAYMRTLFITNFSINIVRSVLLLVIIGLFAYKKLNAFSAPLNDKKSMKS